MASEDETSDGFVVVPDPGLFQIPQIPAQL